MTHFVRYAVNSKTYFGVLEGERVRELEGGFLDPSPSGVKCSLSEVKLLAPCAPSKILAVGRNYKTHLSGPIQLPEPARPEVFFKPVSSLQDPEGPIVVPADSTDLHFEGELVLVVGKRLRSHLRQRCKREELAARTR